MADAPSAQVCFLATPSARGCRHRLTGLVISYTWRKRMQACTSNLVYILRPHAPTEEAGPRTLEVAAQLVS